MSRVPPGEPDSPDHIHVRAIEYFDERDPTGTKKLVVEVWPLPPEMVGPLAIILRDAVDGWMTIQTTQISSLAKETIDEAKESSRPSGEAPEAGSAPQAGEGGSGAKDDGAGAETEPKGE